MEDLFAKIEKQKGLFRKKPIRSRGSLWNKGKGEGLMAKLPSPSSPSHWETGEERRLAGGGPIRARWTWAAAGGEGKGEGWRPGGDPGLTSGWVGAQRRGGVGRRRRAGMAAAAALRVRRRG